MNADGPGPEPAVRWPGRGRGRQGHRGGPAEEKGQEWPGHGRRIRERWGGPFRWPRGGAGGTPTAVAPGAELGDRLLKDQGPSPPPWERRAKGEDGEGRGKAPPACLGSGLATPRGGFRSHSSRKRPAWPSLTDARGCHRETRGWGTPWHRSKKKRESCWKRRGSFSGTWRSERRRLLAVSKTDVDS